MEVPGRSAGESKDTAAGLVESFGIVKSGIAKSSALTEQSFSRSSRFPSMRRSGGTLALLALLAGCGAQYRPVVNPVRPTGPSPAPSSFAVSITQPTGAGAGVVTVLDFSGDSVLAQATLGNYPLDFTLDASGSTAYTIDQDGSLSDIPISTSLQTKNVQTSTLTQNAIPINTVVGTGNLYVLDQASDQINVLTGTPPGLKQAIQFPQGVINLAGRSSAVRLYAISQLAPTSSATAAGVGTPAACATPANVTTNGVVSALEASTNTISATIPVGICPVYGLGSSDGLRAFILNRGSGTVTVIDAQKNTLDTQVNPTTGLPNSTITLPAGPVYAEIYDTASQLVTANYDSNTISVIDVTTDTFNNDAPTFGNIHNITVGNGPSSVTVLQDGSRAYVANSKDGTISVISMISYSVLKTITLPLNPDGTTPHPRMVASSFNYPTGKVYVTSPDSSNLVILRTDTDTVSTTLQLQGNLVDTRVTRQNSNGSTQLNNASYSPGNGVPCTPGTVLATSIDLSIRRKSACYIESGQPF